MNLTSSIALLAVFGLLCLLFVAQTKKATRRDEPFTMLDKEEVSLAEALRRAFAYPDFNWNLDPSLQRERETRRLWPDIDPLLDHVNYEALQGPYGEPGHLNHGVWTPTDGGYDD